MEMNEAALVCSITMVGSHWGWIIRTEGEAISLGVLPGESSISIHDSTSIIRAAFLERKDSPPIMYGVHLLSRAKIDMDILRLNPYASKHVVTQASDAALNRVLDDMNKK